ncbi:MAG: TatD family hydrolase, partial [Clostridia bacterium]|nr:TatD family hydrolase [Clostridia bacterium]
DCPYMTPEPHRGKVNEPCNVKYVYEQMAKVKEIDLETLAKSVEENFKRLFTKYN